MVRRRRWFGLAIVGLVGAGTVSPTPVGAEAVAQQREPWTIEHIVKPVQLPTVVEDVPFPPGSSELPYPVEGAPDTQTIDMSDPSVRVDGDGRIYIVDPPPPLEQQAFAAPVAEGPYPNSQTFLLNSRPGSNRTIFLDFDGHTVSNTAWAVDDSGPFAAAPFDMDSAPSTYSTAEHNVIQDVWRRVAEAYGAFDVNVTTQDPGFDAINRANVADNAFGTRALITNSTAMAVYGSNAGGVAYIGTFDEPGPGHASYQPAWVFAGSLSHNSKNIADATSHEVGHNLGLNHDGTSSASYYQGHGVWAPIMGVGYYRPVVQWSKGEYATASNTQDDIAVMAQNGLTIPPDDHSNDYATATALVSSASGVITPSATLDGDLFKYVAPTSGYVTFTVEPAPAGATLDAELRLYNGGQTLVATDNPDPVAVSEAQASGLGASVTHIVVAGSTYYLQVVPSGYLDASTGYSTYGSIGRYTLTAGPPPAPFCPPDDGYEENDEPAQAMVVLPGPAFEANACAYDDDWFAVDLEAGSELVLDLSFTHVDGDLDMVLFDPDGIYLTSSNGVTDTETIISTVPADGRYSVYIYGFNGAQNTYELTVSVSSAECWGLVPTVRLGSGEVPTAGDDVVLGTGGVDVVDAGLGNDVVCGLGGDDSLSGGDGHDIVLGDGGDDEVFGGVGNDQVYGFDGVDSLDGGGGDDYLWGGIGVDSWDGGDGSDLLYGDDDAETMNGGAGDDQVYGYGGVDQLVGDGGQDYLWGGAEVDGYDGGDGADWLAGGDEGESMVGGAGDDIVLGHGGDDSLVGGVGSDYLWGGPGIDGYVAGDDRDYLEGGEESESMDGGSGDDIVLGHGGDDLLIGGVGSDYLWGGAGVDGYLGDGGIDYLDGAGFDDGETMNGGDDGDYVLGHGGNDVLNGEGGDDYVWGGAGDDALSGGGGVDYCEGDVGTDSADATCETVTGVP